MIKNSRTLGLTLAFAVAGATLAACGDAGTASSGDHARSVVVFMPPGSDNYLAEWQRGARAEAQKLGIDIKILENQFSQPEQDTQVQQQLGSGSKPDAYIWWPVDNAAGLASLKKLHDSDVPTFQTNQNPDSRGLEYIVAYAGVDDTQNGDVSGQLAVQARDKLKESGVPLHSAGGNAIAVTFPAGYGATEDRMKGFQKRIEGSGIQVIAEAPAGFDQTTGYKIGAQLIAANKAKGIDIVYAENDALADGAIQALEEAGYQPGKNVAVVGGNCHGDFSNLQAGKQFGTGLQAASLEGQYTVDVVNTYLKTKQVKDGEARPEASPDKAPTVDSVSRYNFIPNPMVHSNEVQSTSLWGHKMTDLCTY
ncbi:substrate-binding domain-containing protein [Amycolatopsis granulosa]|uniref:substrate-binding domain-containing protein n=1 Tax=Amycolatopsis granulosa TaxID=185684 RepID=UPI00141E5298|nr:ABC-type sugar transport system substrate-binding protein [Amycolatopsis granulosa]